MRIFAAVLGLAVVFLQYRVWLSDHGVREVSRLSSQVEAQAAANVEQRERNRQLMAEVTDLKIGLTALEERARSDLGMVGNNETFYQVVTSGAAQSPAEAGAAQAGAAQAGAAQAGSPGSRPSQGPAGRGHSAAPAITARAQ